MPVFNSANRPRRFVAGRSLGLSLTYERNTLSIGVRDGNTINPSTKSGQVHSGAAGEQAFVTFQVTHELDRSVPRWTLCILWARSDDRTRGSAPGPLTLAPR